MYIPDSLFQKVGNPITMGVLFFLISSADEQGRVYMSYSEIGRNMGYEKWLVYRHIQRLVKYKVLMFTFGDCNAPATAVQRPCNDSATVLQRQCNEKGIVTVCDIASYKGAATAVQRPCNAPATAVQRPCNDTATKVVSPIKQKSVEIKPLFGDEKKDAIIARWLAYKKERGQTYKPLGLQTLKARLIKLSEDNIDKMEQIVEQSMANNYAGLFPLKGDNSPTDKMRKDGTILQPNQMDVTKGGW